jgi:hypothetical protein
LSLEEPDSSWPLIPKHSITDIIGTTELLVLGLLLGLSFATLCGFIAYVDQFNYSCFGGWLNATISSVAYVFLGGLVAWQFFAGPRTSI